MREHMLAKPETHKRDSSGFLNTSQVMVIEEININVRV